MTNATTEGRKPTPVQLKRQRSLAMNKIRTATPQEPRYRDRRLAALKRTLTGYEQRKESLKDINLLKDQIAALEPKQPKSDPQLKEQGNAGT